MKSCAVLNIVNTKIRGRKLEMDKKEALLAKIKQYSKLGVVDITRFRVDNPKEYNLLAHHFGGINNAIDLAGVSKVAHKMQDNKQVMSIRDQLAYDMFHVCYAHKFSLESLSARYQCNVETISNLFNALYESNDVKNEEEYKFFQLDNKTNKILDQSLLRDKMTLDNLTTLRTQYKETLESIGEKYNCSRSAIDQLHRSLLKKFKKLEQKGK